ncbi:MAG: hypothetical protein ABSA40_09640 [Candidatus Dormibacteria bacterium]|jgi:hypothetical protein
MSWLGRLFGSSPPPHPHSVVIADDLAAALTASGAPLGEAVDGALRSHLGSTRRAGEAQAGGEKIPFWLGREEGGSGEIEDTLRDRISQRRASEEDR